MNDSIIWKTHKMKKNNLNVILNRNQKSKNIKIDSKISSFEVNSFNKFSGFYLGKSVIAHFWAIIIDFQHLHKHFLRVKLRPISFQLVKTAEIV